MKINLSSEVLKKSLSKKFSPEFLNRIDEIVVFNQLTSVEIEKIAKIEISNFVQRLKKLITMLRLIIKYINLFLTKVMTKSLVLGQ